MIVGVSKAGRWWGWAGRMGVGKEGWGVRKLENDKHRSVWVGVEESGCPWLGGLGSCFLGKAITVICRLWPAPRPLK